MPLEIWKPGATRARAICPGCHGRGGTDGEECVGCRGDGMMDVEVMAERVISRCRIPTKDGPCGATFFVGQELVVARHAAVCAPRNQEYIVAAREAIHPEIMQPWDKDLDRWVTDHKDAILEGRKTI